MGAGDEEALQALIPLALCQELRRIAQHHLLGRTPRPHFAKHRAGSPILLPLLDEAGSRGNQEPRPFYGRRVAPDAADSR